MKELLISDKQKYLDEHYPFEEIPELIEKNVVFTVTQFFTSDITKYIRTKWAKSIFAVPMHQIAKEQ